MFIKTFCSPDQHGCRTFRNRYRKSTTSYMERKNEHHNNSDTYDTKMILAPVECSYWDLSIGTKIAFNIEHDQNDFIVASTIRCFGNAMIIGIYFSDILYHLWHPHLSNLAKFQYLYHYHHHEQVKNNPQLLILYYI